MNRHKAYWSAMGIEAEAITEQIELKEKIEKLICRYGFDNVVTQLRILKVSDTDVGKNGGAA